MLLKGDWSVFIVECSDKTLFSGMSLDVKREIILINKGFGGKYLQAHPDKLPVRLVFLDDELPFKEAFSKYQYLREMCTPQRKRLIKSGEWVIGGFLKKYAMTGRIDHRQKGRKYKNRLT